MGSSAGGALELEELEVEVAGLDEHRAAGAVADAHDAIDEGRVAPAALEDRLEAEHVDVERARPLEVRDRERDVVDASDRHAAQILRPFSAQ